jgi:hypothetical protein
MFITGMRANSSSKTSVSSIGTPAARAAAYTTTLAAAATSAATRPTCHNGRARRPSRVVVMWHVLPVACEHALRNHTT